jgi:alkanesulfonate monooxygenase SsuD/methylene tetrahydromethanopterin reductase-like flavin-dependent oxidoreductase (luciferase family)
LATTRHVALTRANRPARPDVAVATEAAALFGRPQDLIAGLRALQAVGVRYVLISGGEARQSLRRFAAEVMPAFLTHG